MVNRSEDELVVEIAQELARCMIAGESSSEGHAHAQRVQQSYAEYGRVAKEPDIAHLASRIAGLGAPYQDILRDLTVVLNLSSDDSISTDIGS